MNSKIPYVVAAALAFAAAAIYHLRADPGEDVTLRVVVLVFMGAVMLWLGLLRKAPRNT